MDNALEPPRWQCLKTPMELQELMNLYGNFHDGCIREIHVATGHYVEEDLSMHVDWRTTVHMLIQRQFRSPCAIELRFEEVVGLRVVPPPPDYEEIIFHAAFFARDGIYYWAQNITWTPESPDADETNWVAARKVSWREASDWLGPRLRYRTGPE